MPLTISIIPAITALVVRGEHREASRQSAASIRVAALVFMPMGVGLAVLAEPIMRVIYPTGNAAGPLLLSLLGVGAIVMCLGQMSTAVLQANRLELWPVLGMVIGGVVKILVNYTLVGNPKIGIYGAPIGTLACYAVMCAMNALFLRLRPAEPVRVLLLAEDAETFCGAKRAIRYADLGMFVLEFESEEGKAILKELGIEGDYEGIGHLILGYAAAPAAEPKPRKENYIYTI